MRLDAHVCPLYAVADVLTSAGLTYMICLCYACTRAQKNLPNLAISSLSDTGDSSPDIATTNDDGVAIVFPDIRPSHPLYTPLWT